MATPITKRTTKTLTDAFNLADSNFRSVAPDRQAELLSYMRAIAAEVERRAKTTTVNATFIRLGNLYGTLTEAIIAAIRDMTTVEPTIAAKTIATHNTSVAHAEKEFARNVRDFPEATRSQLADAATEIYAKCARETTSPFLARAYAVASAHIAMVELGAAR